MSENTEQKNKEIEEMEKELRELEASKIIEAEELKKMEIDAIKKAKELGKSREELIAENFNESDIDEVYGLKDSTNPGKTQKANEGINQQDAEVSTADNNDGNEKNKAEEALLEKEVEDTREAYIKEYFNCKKEAEREFKIEKTRIATYNILSGINNTFSNNKLKKDKFREEDYFKGKYKELKKAYDQAVTDMGNYLYNKKVSELKSKGISDQELEEKLNKYQATEILVKTVINEQKKLIDAKKSRAPIDPTLWKKLTDGYHNIKPEWRRVALSTLLVLMPNATVDNIKELPHSDNVNKTTISKEHIFKDTTKNTHILNNKSEDINKSNNVANSDSSINKVPTQVNPETDTVINTPHINDTVDDKVPTQVNPETGLVTNTPHIKNTAELKTESNNVPETNNKNLDGNQVTRSNNNIYSTHREDNVYPNGQTYMSTNGIEEERMREVEQMRNLDRAQNRIDRYGINIASDPRHLETTADVRRAFGGENVIIDRPESNTINNIRYEDWNRAAEHTFEQKGVRFASYAEYEKEIQLQELFGYGEVGVEYVSSLGRNVNVIKMSYFRQTPGWSIIRKIPARDFFSFDRNTLSNHEIKELVKTGFLKDRIINLGQHSYSFVQQGELERLADFFSKIDPFNAGPIGDENIENYISRLTKHIHQTEDGTLFLFRKGGSINDEIINNGMVRRP
ncbi:MAG: hypothetical protein KGI58_00155 [Patescibacteria group bacterium]|nr:hypothetical protein [Patescibacteria group bacterium]